MTITAARTKTAWYLSFDVSAFDSIDKVRITMKYPHSIPLWRTNGELLRGDALSRVVLSSAGARWNDVVVEQRHSSPFELADVRHKQHVIGINIGPSNTWEFKKAGRFRRFFKARGGICFFPSHQPFSCRPNVAG